MDNLTANDDFILAKDSTHFVIYQKMGPKEVTLLPASAGGYSIRWYNPRTGEFAGSEQTLRASDQLSLDPSSVDPEMDWVIWVQKL